MPAPPTDLAAPARGRPWLRAVLTMLLVLILVVLTTVVSLGDRRYRPTGGWAGHLPAGSHRSSDGVAGGRVIETRTVVRQQLADVLPVEWHPLAAELGLTQLWGQQWHRTTLRGDRTDAAGWVTRSTGGSVLLLASTGEPELLFVPMLPLLPADQASPVPGRSTRWQAEGEAHRRDGASPVRYRFEGSLSVADDPAWAGRGCVAVQSVVTLEDGEPRAERLVLCPGAGVVDRTEPDERRRELPAYPRPPPRDAPPAVAPDPTRWRVGHGSLAETATSVRNRRLGAVSGEWAVVTADARAEDLLGWRPSSEDWGRPVWRVHPGHTLLGVEVVDDVVLASTTGRTVVAYDTFGRWLWQVRSPDVVTVPAVDLGGGVVALVDRSGAVQARDLRTGGLRWDHRLAGSVTQAPAGETAAGLLAVVDGTGELTVLDRDGRVRASHDVDPLEVQGVRLHRGALYVVETAGLVRIDPDGERWRRLLGPGELLAVDDELVVHRSGTTVVALSSQDGDLRWRAAGAGAAAVPVGDGSLVLLVLDEDVVLRTLEGEVVGRHPLVGDQQRLALAGPPVPVRGPHGVGIGWVQEEGWLFWGEPR